LLATYRPSCSVGPPGPKGRYPGAGRAHS
jgi:hypothetical protein